MFFLLVSRILSESGDADIIQSYMDEKNYQGAVQYATQVIISPNFSPNEISIYYLRGQSNYQLHNFVEAIEDFDRVLNSTKSDQKMRKNAHKSRGFCNINTGKIEQAKIDQQKAEDEELTKFYNEIDALYTQIKTATTEGKYDVVFQAYDTLAEKCRYSLDMKIEAAKYALKLGLEDKFLEISTKVVELEPSNLEVLELRGIYFLCNADHDFAKRHLLTCAKKAKDKSKCQKLNRYNNEFQNYFNKFAEAENTSNVEDASKFYEKVHKIANGACKNTSKLWVKAETLKARTMAINGTVRGAISYLNDLDDAFPNNTDVFTARADINFNQGDIDEANRDYQAAKRIDDKIQHVNDRILEIFNIHEAERNVNYYELLNLSHNFTKTQLKDAMRKATRLYHPDQYSDPAKKKECERMMAKINRGVEILGDPVKRAVYDSGDDPDNPGFKAQQEKQRAEEERLKREAEEAKLAREQAAKAAEGLNDEKKAQLLNLDNINPPRHFVFRGIDFGNNGNPFGINGNPWIVDL